MVALLMRECPGPRTACAGLDGNTWPVTSQSNNMRMQVGNAVGVIGSRETDATTLVSEFVQGDRLRRPPVVPGRMPRNKQWKPQQKRCATCASRK